jgi:mannitol-1-phosphate 5-dehydrogenase
MARATFVGFGFGAIQAGLFCLEAVQSGAFRPIVVAEILPETVAAVRAQGGQVVVNVAHADHLEPMKIGPIALENPAVYADRARLVEAVAAAAAIATAVPSVRAYRSRGPGSLHRVLAEGLLRKAAVGGPHAVVYVAENTPHAAALLRAAVMEEIPEAERAAVGDHVDFVDTVIAKMCGMISPPDDLTPLTPGLDRALLVEAFNRIQVARPQGEADVAEITASFPTFQVEEDLTPFEQAKFFGHNGIHAVGAYLGAARGLTTMAELAAQPGMVDFLRCALLEEAGRGLIDRYAGVDARFTPAGYAAYADDLITRIVNPFLRDGVARVARDPERKLGWEDRLVGTMRMALQAGVVPTRFALGTAAALEALGATHAAQPDARARLTALWAAARPDPTEAATLLALIEEGAQRLAAWRAAGFPDLAHWWAMQPQAV